MLEGLYIVAHVGSFPVHDSDIKIENRSSGTSVKTVTKATVLPVTACDMEVGTFVPGVVWAMG